MSKLSDEKVRQIEAQLASNVPRKEIAAKYGISVETVGRIARQELTCQMKRKQLEAQLDTLSNLITGDQP